MQVLILKDLLQRVPHPDQIPWQPLHKGVEIYQLYGDRSSGPSAALLRYQPGASVPQHFHQGFEHILVLEGAQTDLNGKHEAGTLVINFPDSTHSVVSESGCIVLAIWEKPITLWS